MVAVLADSEVHPVFGMIRLHRCDVEAHVLQRDQHPFIGVGAYRGRLWGEGNFRWVPAVDLDPQLLLELRHAGIGDGGPNFAVVDVDEALEGLTLDPGRGPEQGKVGGAGVALPSSGGCGSTLPSSGGRPFPGRRRSSLAGGGSRTTVTATGGQHEGKHCQQSQQPLHSFHMYSSVFAS